MTIITPDEAKIALQKQQQEQQAKEEAVRDEEKRSLEAYIDRKLSSGERAFAIGRDFPEILDLYRAHWIIEKTGEIRNKGCVFDLGDVYHFEPK